MPSLLDAVRKACLPAIWSQGVKLARDAAVTRAKAGDGEVVLRVRAPGQAVAPTVTLYTEGLEWSCDCNGKADPCAHVAAAAIAEAQGSTVEGGAQEAEARGARLVYRLAKRERILTLAR